MSAHGGIITSEFLETIQGENVKNPRVEPQCFAAFNQPTPTKDKRELGDKIANSFKLLLERWDAISLRYQKMSVSEARSKWMVPLFKELGFDPDFRREEIVVGGDDKLRFRLSHRGWSSELAPKIHMVAPAQDLEEASDGGEGEVVRRGRTRSPHDEMQAYLNVTKGLKWGIVTNGILLRVLREYFHTTTKGYVEFDLENIFRERSFTDFRAMYRLVHASRFLPDQDGTSPLEQFYKESVAAGVKVGEDLRKNVKKAIEALGNGFLTPELTKKMIEDEEFCKAYYAELLRVIYRLLFLLFAEQRAMLPTKGSLYIEEYSITRLREMAETRHGKDDHHDLWEGLRVTFHMLKKGCLPLKVFGYNGSLFDDAELSILSQQQCKNEDVLRAIRNLTLVEEERVLKRINYLDLGVEEIGSIYESLLDFAPRVFDKEQEIDEENVPSNTFFLDPRGVARKSSGSYYTHPRLIDELIKSALKPVVDDKIANVVDKQNALLSVKVCDPACGSGAFLIAANNYLSRELAKLRTGQAEPSDKEVKKATREVLQHCIYGVDLNPMAVELAKVSLWINSCVEDMPLNFLDHHIKCGNSLIGSNSELLSKGIPDKAFDPVGEEDKTISKRIKLQNSIQQKDKLLSEFGIGTIEAKKEAQEYASLSELAEKSSEDVDAKKSKYIALVKSPEFLKEKEVANCWTSAFFCPLNKEAPQPPTQGILRSIQLRGLTSIHKETANMIEKLSKDYSFFHWEFEFPDVFLGEGKGFDCIIGNPPWDKLIKNSDEFFNFYVPDYRAQNNRDKKRLQEELCKDNVILKRWLECDNYFSHTTKFFVQSDAFVYQGSGTINAFKLFIEKAYQICGLNGRIGLLVPSGVYTDEGCTELRKLLFDKTKLEYLLCMENKQKIFPIHSSFKFVVLVTGKGGPTEEFSAGFMIHDLDVLSNLKENGLRIPVRLVKRFSPDTLSVMEFASQEEIMLMEKLYGDIPLLGEEISGTWNAKFHRELHLSDDKDIIQTKQTPLRIFEGKMIHHYYYLYEEPRFWMLEKDALDFYAHWGYQAWKEYRLAYRLVASSTNETTLITTIIPKDAASVNSLMILEVHSLKAKNLVENISESEQCFLTALMNSFVMNYILRRKISANLSAFYIYQLPIPRYKAGNWFFDQLVCRSARLICTTDEYAELWAEVYRTTWKNISQDLTSELDDWSILEPKWTTNCGVQGWDETKHDIGKRAQLRCEIDAFVAHLFKLTEPELKYILSTFPIVKEKTPWLIDGVIREYIRLSKHLKT